MKYDYDKAYDEALLNGASDYLAYARYSYIANFLRSIRANSPKAPHYFGAIIQQLEFCLEDDLEELKQKALRDNGKSAKEAAKKTEYKPEKEHIENLLHVVERHKNNISSEQTTAIRNICQLSDDMGFDDLTRQAFEFLYLISNDELFDAIFDDIAGNNLNHRSAVMAAMTGNPGYGKLMANICGDTGPLMESGFIMTTYEGTISKPVLSDVIIGPLEQPDVNMHDLIAHLFPAGSGDVDESELTLDDFDDLRPQLDPIIQRLVYAVKNGEKGINILFHGDPGVGKSVLVKAITQACGYRCISMGEGNGTDNLGTNSEAQKRIAEAKRVNALARFIRNQVIGQMDEAEDLLLKTGDSSKSADPQSKIEVNRLLEDNVVPTIYTVNDIGKFHPSFIQRFTAHMYVPERSVPQQASIWSQMLQKHGVETIDEDHAYGLARQYNLAPREIEHLSKLAAATQKPLQAIDNQVREKAHAARQDVRAYDRINSVRPKFDPDFITASEKRKDNIEEKPDLDKLAHCISERQAIRALIEQRQAQGAIAFSRYLAERGGMDTLEADGYNLAESAPMAPAAQKIAQAFAEAASRGAFLVVRNMQGFACEPNSPASQWRDEMAIFAEHLKAHDLPVSLVMTDGPRWPETHDHLLSHRFSMTALDPQSARSAIAHYCEGFARESIKLPDRAINIGDIAKLGHQYALRPDHYQTPDDVCCALDRIVRNRQEAIKQPPGFHTHKSA